jgi:hypothetical protein
MQSVRLHVAGDGVVWALSKCRVCGSVDKHPVAEAIASPIRCKKCGHMMDMTGAVIEAVKVNGNGRLPLRARPRRVHD